MTKKHIYEIATGQKRLAKIENPQTLQMVVEIWKHNYTSDPKTRVGSDVITCVSR